ncbi:MAG: hypothetical protein PHE29_08340, partial [Tissierellia bacterium]|nr:hypothetical protein [Tissierellia bacterium]
YNKITGSGKIIDRYDELLVFKPELMPKTNIKIKKIPPLNIKDVNFKTIINYIFGYKKWIITEKIVFFEQPYNSTNLYNEIKKIADEILFENYIVKLHPRSKKDNYRYFNIYENNNIPWEIICLNNDIESKILISFYSTATITNKILFNKEPILIFLFNLPHLKEIHPLNDDTIKFITEFKKTYKDPNRILIPDSIDSLKISLETLLND